MTCDEATRALSARLDGEQVDDHALDRHLATCDSCRHVLATARQARHALRVVSADPGPDMLGPVRAAASRAPAARPPDTWTRENWARVAVALVAGAVAGATLVGIGRDPAVPIAAADLPASIEAAQRQVHWLDAEVELVERGWHPAVPVRRYHGSLHYRAPEDLTLELHDATVYPDQTWAGNDVRLETTAGTRQVRGLRDCPVHAQPACTPPDPRVEVTRRVEPFAARAPLPLELVTPVRSLSLDAPDTAIGPAVDGRSTVAVVGRAARFSSLIDAFRPAGNLRQVHPSDGVELLLDRDLLAPVGLTVRAADDPARAAWARARGYQDEPGTAVIEVRVRALRGGAGAGPLGEPATRGEPHPPSLVAIERDGGFSPGVSRAPSPDRLPPGFRAHRAGQVRAASGPTIDVRSWTDGRAWLKVRSTTEWQGSRLFGDVGPLARRVDGGALGVAYVADDLGTVAVHAEGLDVEVTGSLPVEALLDVAARLGVRGRAVPPAWDQAATGDLTDAARVPGVVLPPGGRLSGFALPAVRVDGTRVTLRYAGPGSRVVDLVQAPGDRLSPPIDPDVRGVSLGGVDGRFSPAAGELAWAEDGRVHALHSTTLSVGELADLAAEVRGR